MDHVGNIARTTGRSRTEVSRLLRACGFGLSWAEQEKRIRAFIDAVNRSSIRLR